MQIKLVGIGTARREATVVNAIRYDPASRGTTSALNRRTGSENREDRFVSNPRGSNGRRLLFGMSVRQSAVWTAFILACAITSMVMSLWPIITIAAFAETAILGSQTLAAYRSDQGRAPRSR